MPERASGLPERASGRVASGLLLASLPGLGAVQRGEQPVEELQPAPVVLDLLGHAGPRRVRAVAREVPEAAPVQLRTLRRPRREQRAAEDPKVVRFELEIEPHASNDGTAVNRLRNMPPCAIVAGA